MKDDIKNKKFIFIPLYIPTRTENEDTDCVYNINGKVKLPIIMRYYDQYKATIL